MFNWNGIADRFFSFYKGKSQKDIAELYGIPQASVSKWKIYEEKIPLKHLEKMFHLEGDKGIVPEWIVFGINKKSPPATASGEQGLDVELITTVFQLQENLSGLGQHLAVGKSADAFPEIDGLLDNVRKLQERLAAFEQTPEIHDRTA